MRQTAIAGIRSALAERVTSAGLRTDIAVARHEIQQSGLPLHLPRRVVPEVLPPGHHRTRRPSAQRDHPGGVRRTGRTDRGIGNRAGPRPTARHLRPKVRHPPTGQIKGRSSWLLRQEFPSLKSKLPTLWTNSYFVANSGWGDIGGRQPLRREPTQCVTDALTPHG